MPTRLHRDIFLSSNRVLGLRRGMACCWAPTVTLLLMAALLAVGTSDSRAAELPLIPSPAKVATPDPESEPSKVVTAASATTETVASETSPADAADEAMQTPAEVPDLTTILVSVLQAFLDDDSDLRMMGTGTHPRASAISVACEDGSYLQTMCLNVEGHVLALVGPSCFSTSTRPMGPRLPIRQVRHSEVREYESDGTLVRSWKLSYAATAICVGPDGTIYVAGSGQLSRFDPTGKELVTQELPHVIASVQDRDALRKEAEAQRDSNLEFLETEVIQSRRRVEQLEARQREAEAAKAGDKSAAASDSAKSRRQRPQATLSQQIDFEKEHLKGFEDAVTSIPSIEALIDSTRTILRTVSALAVSERDIFVVTREQKSYGYCIVRYNLNLSEHETIVTGLNGCCGQMDVQCHDGQVWAAENHRHRVCGFDRDGKRLSSFGKSSRQGKGGHFGGCCNPMNLRFGPNGDIYTADSEGMIKRFSAAGEYKDLVRWVQLEGGCRNVAVDVSRDGHQVFFCDQFLSRIIVLTQPDETVTQAD